MSTQPTTTGVTHITATTATTTTMTTTRRVSCQPFDLVSERDGALMDSLEFDGLAAASPLQRLPKTESEGGMAGKSATMATASLTDDSPSEAALQATYKPTNRFMRVLNTIVPHGGLVSNAYNLASVTLGSGVISLPSAFQSLGVVPSVIVLLVITLSTVYSVYILLQAVERAGRQFVSYESLARNLLGRGWDYLAAFNMWMVCFGSCVSYVISVNDLLTRATDGPSVNSFLRSRWGPSVLTLIVWFCVMLPMSIPKEINSLRYFSVIGVSCMMYFVIIIVVHACLHGLKDGKPVHDIAMFKTGNNAVVGFSLFIFSYMCQTNTLEVYREMKKPTPARLTRDTAISMWVVCGLYILSGFFGYLEFGEAITDSILRFYDVRHDVVMMIAYIGIGFKLCVGFAICMQPSRDSVYYCLSWHFPVFKDLRKVPFWLNALICSFMAVVALVLGLFIPSVNIVFSLVGSFCGGFLCFIFPALYIMYAGSWTLRKVGWFHYISTYTLLLGGVIAIVFGTVAAIYGMVQ